MAVLNVHDLGDPHGAPVLAIHGITAHGLRFRRLATEAWPQLHTFAVDLRGHGRSLSDGPWSIPQHVRDLLDTLDAHGLDRVDVVGHSYGGAIGLALLAAAPDRVRRFVMLDPALRIPGEQASENALRTISDPGWATIEEATIARNAGFGDEIHPAVVEDVAEHLVQGDDGRFRFRFHRPAVVTGWGEVCHPLPAMITPCPALLVVADRAGLVADDTIELLRAMFGDLLRVEHLDCGHMLYWDDFDGTVAAVAPFLRAEPA